MNLQKRILETSNKIKSYENMFTSGDVNECILKNQYQIMLSLQEILAKLEDIE